LVGCFTEVEYNWQQQNPDPHEDSQQAAVGAAARLRDCEHAGKSGDEWRRKGQPEASTQHRRNGGHHDARRDVRNRDSHAFGAAMFVLPAKPHDGARDAEKRQPTDRGMDHVASPT
jgi:hypothetical protein